MEFVNSSMYMGQMKFRYQQSCGVSIEKLLQIAQDAGLRDEQKRFFSIARTDKNYNHPFSCVNLPEDHDLYAKIQTIVAEIELLKPTILVVVGIGGSSLGAKAVLQAIQGRVRDSKMHALRVYFAETVDTDRMYTIMSIVQQELVAGNNISINVVTKSGTTLETMANFYVLVDLLRQHRPDEYKKFVVVTTGSDSPLWAYAHEQGYRVLEVPKNIGGRYSVFSAVGLFPLALAGIDIQELRAGAAQTTTECFSEDFSSNPAVMSALIHYHYYRQGVRISDLFMFSVDLEALGKWYRQLMAESLGKEFDINGISVLAGITPTVSLGSIDLHSVAQLYLGGPRDKYTTFVMVSESAHAIAIPADAPAWSGKTFAGIMHALAEGTQAAYLKTERPFASVVLPKKNEFFIGQFLQWKIIEMIYLGYLLEVDCFDQPNVELYKKEALRLLA